jgi:cholesterol oxidase
MSENLIYNRRRFIRDTALFSTGLVTSLVTNRLAQAEDEPIDAIVIGSGFGGAVAALRLGQAGIKTLILERGRHWSITPAQNTFTTFRQPDGRAAWLSPTTFEGIPVGDIYTGVLELKQEKGIGVLCGAGVGGGSLVYNAVTYQPPRELFDRVFSKAIDYDEMDRVYYPRVRSIIKPAPIPQDILSTDYYLAYRAFLKEAQTAGLNTRLVDAAVDWNIVRQEIKGQKKPSAILGEHWFGINSGAKRSLDRNYLPLAKQTGNVDILALHQVTGIWEVPGYGYRITCNKINESGEVIQRKTFTCRYLFLAAGSMGTSALLVKAKATGTLPKLNNYVGLDWGSNGDCAAIRLGIPKTTLNPAGFGQGGPSGPLVEYFDNPFAPITIQPFARWNAPQGVLVSLGIGFPSIKRRFKYDPTTGAVNLTDAPEDTPLLDAWKFTYQLIDRKNATTGIKPTTQVNTGVYPTGKNRVTKQILSALTAHPLGGVVLGKACDLYGRVFGYRGLYVVDGSLIPGSTGCTNPSFTIAALAERCMDKILDEDIRRT